MEIPRARTPRYDGNPLQFELPMGWEPRTVHDLRRLLWVEVDRQGDEVPLSAVQAFFDAEKRLTGVRLVYSADVEREIGICVGELVSASLGEHEVPVAMEADIRLGPGISGSIIVVCITFSAAAARACPFTTAPYIQTTATDEFQ